MARQRARRVGSRELKTRLGTWLRRVQAGERIIVTDRGRPVAELAPLGEDPLDALVAAGRVSRATRDDLAEFEPERVRGRSVSDALMADREDRF